MCTATCPPLCSTWTGLAQVRAPPSCTPGTHLLLWTRSAWHLPSAVPAMSVMRHKAAYAYTCFAVQRGQRLLWHVRFRAVQALGRVASREAFETEHM